MLSLDSCECNSNLEFCALVSTMSQQWTGSHAVVDIYIMKFQIINESSENLFYFSDLMYISFVLNPPHSV